MCVKWSNKIKTAYIKYIRKMLQFSANFTIFSVCLYIYIVFIFMVKSFVCRQWFLLFQCFPALVNRLRHRQMLSVWSQFSENLRLWIKKKKQAKPKITTEIQMVFVSPGAVDSKHKKREKWVSIDEMTPANQCTWISFHRSLFQIHRRAIFYSNAWLSSWCTITVW